MFWGSSILLWSTHSVISGLPAEHGSNKPSSKHEQTWIKVLGQSSLLSGRGGCPSPPKVFCCGWHMEGDGGRSGQMFPAQCNQVTSQGVGAGVAGLTGWNRGQNTQGNAHLCSMEIAAGFEFSVLPQSRTSPSKKEQQHWWAHVGGVESVFSLSAAWLRMGTVWSRTASCSLKINLKFS